MRHSLHLYGTLGHACASEKLLKDMFLYGMTGMQINLCDVEPEDDRWLSLYHGVSDRLSIAPEFLLLLQGRKSRSEESEVSFSPLTHKDQDALKHLREYRITGVILPFVEQKEDLLALRRELLKNEMDYVRIFARIESLQGAGNLPAFLPYCDEIILDRHSLGCQLDLPRLPAIQKKISMICNRARKPFMVMGGLLASMEKNPVPSTAEVMDIFQAVSDGASSLMLTGETASGDFPAEAVKILADAAQEALRFMAESRFF